MHTTLTEHARCRWGDENGPGAPPCALDRDDHYFVETLTFADADAIIAMLHDLCPNIVDGLLPVWVRNLAYRLAVLQRPDDVALIREAALSLRMHGPDWDHIADDLTRRASAPEQAAPDGGSGGPTT